MYRFLAILLATLLVSCTSLTTTSSAYRHVRLKVLVNPDFASHALWRQNVENLFDVANDVFKKNP